MTTIRWSRRRFMAMTASASAALLMAACTSTPKVEAPAPASDDPFAGLAPGQGAVLDVAGQQIAAYRTEAGEVIQLDVTCPHEGCPVQWNAAQSRWLCPCHASQFEPDGTFISGPAGTGLRKLS